MSFPVLSTIDVHQQNEAVKGYQKTTYRGGSVESPLFGKHE